MQNISGNVQIQARVRKPQLMSASDFKRFRVLIVICNPRTDPGIRIVVLIVVSQGSSPGKTWNGGVGASNLIKEVQNVYKWSREMSLPPPDDGYQRSQRNT